MDPRTLFDQIAGIVSDALQSGERFTCYLTGEDSDFIRLNHNQVRQAGHVEQRYLSIDLMEGSRHTVGVMTLSGALELDRGGVKDMMGDLRAQRPFVKEDPYLHYAEEVHNTEHIRPSSLPAAEQAIAAVTRAGEGLDLVGIWASGTLFRGFANSFEQRNWFQTATFNFDWSCYHRKDKAVKCGYAGFDWDEEVLIARMEQARREVKTMALPPKTIPPGKYRAYLAPQALAELVGLLGWGGFGLKSHRTGNTPLVKMVREGQRFDPSVEITENHAKGMSPAFTREGFILPGRVVLIEKGQLRGALTAARSSKEFGEPVNAASESPSSLFMGPGDLPDKEVLERLDTGVYINNLWYCNYSDRNECRLTGMTRFASFWVENGKIMAPLEVMRFDDSLYRMLGEGLIGLTGAPQFIFDPGTYFERSTGVMELPGLLVEDFQFKL